MKKTFTILVALFFSATIYSQNELYFNFNHLIGDEEFQMNTESMVEGDYEVKINRLEYYISDITVVHDGGQSTYLDDVYLLVDAGEDGMHSLGSWDIDVIEQVSFGIGVHDGVNNDDPAGWPSDHPLNYQTPSMHWGWSSGYRFIALEGTTGFNFLYTFEIHALGNSNFGHATLNFIDTQAESGEVVMDIDANYSNLFVEMDVSSGAIIHGSSQPEAVQTLYNTRNSVFNSNGGAVGIESEIVIEDSEIVVYPNPAQEVLNIDINSTILPNEILIYDYTGKLVLSEGVSQLQTSVKIDELESGVYMMHLQFGDRIITKTFIKE